MSNIQPSLTFFDDGRDNREKENFQGFLFKSIDMRERESPISFQRSDFRGAAFRSSFFFENNFGNADFIDSTIIKTVFEQCSFRHTEIHNSYYENSFLKDSLFSSASFVKTHFSNCDINGSKFNVNTIRECKFENCKIFESKFDRCSIDEVEFSNTHLSDCDLSGNTAINIYFSNCRFNNVVIDGDYIGSYFFKGEFLNNLQMKYRGKVVNIDLSTVEILKNLFKIFFERSRYYEAINTLVQIGILEKKPSTIYQPCVLVIEKLFEGKDERRRLYQLGQIFKLFEYYINTGSIVLSDYFKFISYCERIDTASLSLEEQLFIIGKTSRLRLLLNKIDWEMEFIRSIPLQERVLLEISIEKKDKERFLNLFDKVATGIQKQFDIDETVYDIIGYRKGSLIISMVMVAAPAYFLMKLLRQILSEARRIVDEGSGLLIDIKLKYDLHKALQNKRALDKLKQKSDTIKQIQSPVINQTKTSPKDESEELKSLPNLMKSFIIYPNALVDSRK